MKTFEQWVLEKYPIWTAEQVEAIQCMLSLRQQWVVSGFRQTGKSMMYYEHIQGMITQVIEKLPEQWLTLQGFAKKDPITLDREYFTRHPTMELIRQRRQDLAKTWKNSEITKDVINDDFKWWMANLSERWHHLDEFNPWYTLAKSFDGLVEVEVQKKTHGVSAAEHAIQGKQSHLQSFIDDMFRQRRTAKTLILDSLTPIGENK